MAHTSIPTPLPTGFLCKRCGGPAPVGVGYTDTTPGAAPASQSVSECPCGYSQAHDPIVAAVAERSRLSYAETADIIDGFMAALDRARTEQPQIDP